MKSTVILFGGSSSERLVSVASAQNVSTHLPDARCWFLSKTGAQADGSSHGLIHLKSAAEVDAAAKSLARFALPYLAEVFIEGRESPSASSTSRAGRRRSPCPT